jgi:hypothetical protein
LRYLLGLLAIVALIIILIILIVPGGKKVAPTGAGMLSYDDTNTVVRLTIDGPEVAASNHQSIQITVGKSNVTFTQINGYNNQIVNIQTYNNTEASYEVFLRSLYYADYYKGNTSTAESNEEGVCALGSRYVYEIMNGSNEIQRFWSTDCGGLHTYEGDPNLTMSLFQNQVPNYNSLTANVNL